MARCSPNIVVSASPKAVAEGFDARTLLAQIEVRGGGRADFAQGYTPDVEQALAKAREVLHG